MRTWTTADYDLLESAIRDGRRLMLLRGGSEFVVIPRALRLVARRETIIARHPITGDEVRFPLDEVERFEVVK
ncbi:MAG: hypothetical protein MUF00_09335 [Gemmatimonadaceae bacterium]|jgi:hypothetical protein|nr:hypothetical protein [Gemmatimonadaceae bacterium]